MITTIAPISLNEAIDSVAHNISGDFSGHFKDRSRGECKQCIRYEYRINDIDILTWLSSQHNPEKVYWLDSEHRLEFAGLGFADVLTSESSIDYEELRSQLSHTFAANYKNIRYMGGIRFEPTRQGNDIWDAFGSYKFILPRFELFKQEDAAYFAANLVFTSADSLRNSLSQLEQGLNALRAPVNSTEGSPLELLSRVDTPSKEEWIQNIESVLENIGDRHLQKIVLARKSVFTYSDVLAPLEIVRLLKLYNPYSFHFYFQPREEYSFIVSSPERLYSRRNSTIISEAIAGTRRRGTTHSEDTHLEQELFHSRKDIHEHSLVESSIKNALNNLCESFSASDTLSVLKLAKVQHLSRTFQGTLKNSLSDSDILPVLHPTPSVCGFPEEEAKQIMREIEHFDRGWYAGPVGWLGRNSAEFVVAIRSGLIHSNKIYLFSGAGIVQGSQPLTEWEEIEYKIDNFINVLNHDEPKLRE